MLFGTHKLTAIFISHPIYKITKLYRMYFTLIRLVYLDKAYLSTFIYKTFQFDTSVKRTTGR